MYAIPPTAFADCFETFTDILVMVYKCAYVLYIIFKVFVLLFHKLSLVAV